jgi:hypothetical protein
MSQQSSGKMVNTVAFGSASISAIAAAAITQKFGVPIEVSSWIIGLAAAVGGKLVKFVSKRKK